ncbi:antA/AntB antirepressor family protein [Brevibacillus ginsengisoli]|uniref:antA/AntB antirepressor family protein n=1 Tax=Brevibacillus ginsengisoli TaxID=363854 RepID=UPI003CF180C2
MNETQIITIESTDTGMWIDGRELHEFLEAGTKFTDWIQERIRKYGFVEGADFKVTLTKTGERQNVTRHDYSLSIEMAKELSMVENNEKGRQARRYFIEMEKEAKKLPQLTEIEMIAAVAKHAADQARRLTLIESRIDVTEKRQEYITEVMSLNPTEWRKKTTALLNKIAYERGGHGAYQEVRNESYDKLEDRAKCNLSIRLTNKRRQMALEGVSKSKIDKVSKMDVIADDARLTEIYLAIVKEMAIQYRVDVESA